VEDPLLQDHPMVKNLIKETDMVPHDGLYLVYMRSSNFVARCIQFFMRLYALRFNRIWRKPVNHADIVWKGIAWGTTAKGFLPRGQQEAFRKAKVLYVFALPRNVDDKKIFDVLHKYQYRRYDYKNFWDFTVKLFTGRWKGKTGEAAERALYCIEAVHMVMDELEVIPALPNPCDNDPEESRQWAIDNLEYFEKIEIR